MTDFEKNNDGGVPPSGMSRRSMVRTGANLAWAVPAIAVVTSAPAFAAVSGPPKLPTDAQLDTSASVSGNGLSASVTVAGLQNTGGSVINNPTGDFVPPARVVATSVAKPWTATGAFAKASSKSYRVVLFQSIAPGAAAPPIKLKLKPKKRGQKIKGSVKYMVSGSGASVAGTIKLKK